MYSILRWNQILCSTSSSLSATTEIAVPPRCHLIFFDKTASRFKPRPGGARREWGLIVWGPTVRVTSCHIAVLGDELSGTSCHEASCWGRVDIVPKFVSETSKPWSQHTSTIEAKVGGNFGHRRAKKGRGETRNSGEVGIILTFHNSSILPDQSQFVPAHLGKSGRPPWLFEDNLASRPRNKAGVGRASRILPAHGCCARNEKIEAVREEKPDVKIWDWSRISAWSPKSEKH